MTPRFTITANGDDITALVRDRLVSLRVTDEAGNQADTAELTLDDRDNRIELPPTGAALAISIGYADEGMVGLGSYEVDETEVSGPPWTVTIRAAAARFTADLKSPKERSFQDITIGELVATIAGEHGFTSVVSDEFAAIPLGVVNQTDESDIALLTRYAEMYGAVAKPANGHLVFVREGQSKTASGATLPVVAITPGDVTSIRATFPDRDTYRSVTATWWEPPLAAQQTITVGDGEPTYRLRGDYADSAEANEAATAALGRFTRGRAALEATLVGNPRLTAEGRVSLSGFRDGLNGEWLVKQVVHQLGRNGYTTNITAEVPE